MLFITIDGLGDKLSNKKTTLEKAKTPNLDFLAKEGRCGLVTTVGKGIAPESDVALTAILGYDPKKYHTGRGPLEVCGLNINFKEGDIALRTNFATLDKKNNIIDRRAGRNLTTKEAKELAGLVNKKVKLKYPFLFLPTTEHRGVLIIRGNFSANISNTDPAYLKKGTFGVVGKKNTNKILLSKPLDKSDQSEKTARAVNDFVKKASEVLMSHKVNTERIKKRLLPANIILTRDAGIKLPKFPPRKERWIAATGYTLELGLAKQAGMKVLSIKYPPIKSGDIYKFLYQNLDIEITEATKIIKEKLSKFDHFWFHFKPTDIPGHDGREKDKIKMIEILDKKFFKFLVGFLKNNKKLKIVVTSDHATPTSIRVHSADPVPLLIYDGINKDKIKKFGEHYCRRGSIGHIIGKEVLKLIG